MSIAASGKPTRKKRRTLRGTVNPSKKSEMYLRKAILDAVRPLDKAIKDATPWLTGTATPAQAREFFKRLQDAWRVQYSPKIVADADNWAKLADSVNKARFHKALARTLGVERASVTESATLKAALEASSYEASSLITNICEETVSKTQQAVMRYYQQQEQPEGRTLIQQIHEVIGGERKRAERIARDQTAKINSSMIRARAVEAGSKSYIWRTSGDERVAGNPAGKYPKVDDKSTFHGNHYKRNGKRFYWDDPPPDGHAGEAGFCRCTADPEIDPTEADIQT